MAVQLSSLQVHRDEQPDRKMETVFSRPFLIPILPTGEFGDGRFPPDLTAGDRGVLDSAVRSFQLVLPDAPSEQWEVQEHDQNGQYQAAYTRETGSGAIVKRKLRYVALRQTSVFSINVLSSSVRSEIDTDGLWLKRSKGKERLQIEADGGRVLATIDATFDLEPLDDSEPTGEVLTDIQDLQSSGVKLDAPSTGDSVWDETEKESHRRQLRQAGVTLEKFTGELLAKDANDTEFAHRFAQFLQVFPEEARHLNVRPSRLDDKHVALLFNILQLAGTPEAQNALSEFAESKTESAANRQQALVAIAGLEQPSGDTLERVARMYRTSRDRLDARGLTSSTLLTLGSLVGRAPDAEGKGIARDLQDELRASQDPERQRLLLRACQNGQVKVPDDLVRGFLGSTSPGVREVAVTSLSADRSGSATNALLDIAQRDNVASVRSAAIQGLRAQPATAEVNNAIVRRLTEGRESAPILRGQLVSYLASQMRTFSQNRAVLENHLKHEEDRQVIVAVLNSLR